MVYLSLGSNLGDRQVNLRMAVGKLLNLGNVLTVSSIYETEPVEFTDQPWFLNCVVLIQTEMLPKFFFAGIQEIEKEMGRQRTQPKGPRTIDIDILLFGNATIDTPQLKVPHPAMKQRRFVLAPLAEIAPDVKVPGTKRTARELLEALPANDARINKFRDGLDLLQLSHGALALDVTGVECRLRFQQHDVRLFLGRREVLHTMRDDDELARLNDEFAFAPVLAHAHPQGALHDKEQLVFDLVVVPHKISLQLHHFHVQVVDFTDDLRTELIAEERQLLREVNLLHDISSNCPPNAAFHRKSHVRMGTVSSYFSVTQGMATQATSLPTRGETLRTWGGVLFALFAFGVIRLALGGFSTQASVAQTVIREAVIWLAAGALIWFILRVEHLKLTSVGIGTQPLSQSLLWSLPLTVVCLAAAATVAMATGYGHGQGSTAMERFPLWLATLICIRAGFVEELFYRGYAIERLQSLGMPRVVAAGLPLAVFSLMHLTGGWAGVLMAFVLGGILTAFYLWRRDLVANILAHFLVDFLAQRCAQANAPVGTSEDDEFW